MVLNRGNWVVPNRGNSASILLRSHWVLVVIDVFTRRIIGFGIGGELATATVSQFDARTASMTFICRISSVGDHPVSSVEDHLIS